MNADRSILGFAIASTPPCSRLPPERTHGQMRNGDCRCLGGGRLPIYTTCWDSNPRVGESGGGRRRALHCPDAIAVAVVTAFDKLAHRR